MAQDIETNKLTLTLPQAIERAFANYPALQIQQYSIEQAQGLKTTAGLFPNPVITFYREDLSLNGQGAGETTVYAGLPLNFLWLRWSKISAASAQVDAEQKMLADVQRLIKFEVQKVFVETYFTKRSYQARQKATAVFDKAAKASRVRLADGDMSGYGQQRIALEHLRYQKAEYEARVQLNNSRRQLAFLLDPNQSEVLIETSANFPSPAPEISHENVLAQALQTRPDLQAAKATVRSKQTALTAAKWQRLPEVNAFVGYKKQVDDFKGAVVQVNLGFPIFNRNQGQVRSARAAFDQQALATDLLEKQVALEVRQAYEKYRLYRQQVERFLEEYVESPEQLLEIAQFSYAEGEMSLLELLDGVRAYSESFQTKNDLFLKYQLSIFELEKAVTTSITDY
jgi:cobalt-zinc-cadmium efflux system outer membrane protein